MLGDSPVLSPFSTSMARSFAPFRKLGSTLDHVADANARLSLTETVTTHQPIAAGYQVVQDDNSTTYTYGGDVGGDAGAGLLVTGAGTSDVNGSYTFDGATYTQIGGAGHTVSHEATWIFHSLNFYVGDDDQNYAWRTVSWSVVDGTGPVPTVARNAIAYAGNWTP